MEQNHKNLERLLFLLADENKTHFPFYPIIALFVNGGGGGGGVFRGGNVHKGVPLPEMTIKFRKYTL